MFTATQKVFVILLMILLIIEMLWDIVTKIFLIMDNVAYGKSPSIREL